MSANVGSAIGVDDADGVVVGEAVGVAVGDADSDALGFDDGDVAAGGGAHATDQDSSSSAATQGRSVRASNTMRRV